MDSHGPSIPSHPQHPPAGRGTCGHTEADEQGRERLARAQGSLPTWAGPPHLLTWPRLPAEPAPTCRPRDSSPRYARMVDGRRVTPQNTRARGRLLGLQPAAGWSGLPPTLLSLLASPPVPAQGGMCLLVWGRTCGRPQARFHQLSPKLCPTPYMLS